jgi:copper homeostasis protein
MIIKAPYFIEVCVDNLEDALGAEANGADQIELCSNLDLDGLTPSRKLLDQAFGQLHIPIKPMLRSRSGNFSYTEAEKLEMLKSLEVLKAYPCHSIVFGALDDKNQIDQDFLEMVINELSNHKLCFHKAIDHTPDILESCKVLASYSAVKEVLSSGGAETARKGAAVLLSMKKTLRADQILIGAGKILPENVSELHNLVKLEYYHGRKIIKY